MHRGSSWWYAQNELIEHKIDETGRLEEWNLAQQKVYVVPCHQMLVWSKNAFRQQLLFSPSTFSKHLLRQQATGGLHLHACTDVTSLKVYWYSWEPWLPLFHPHLLVKGWKGVWLANSQRARMLLKEGFRQILRLKNTVESLLSNMKDGILINNKRESDTTSIYKTHSFDLKTVLLHFGLLLPHNSLIF